DRTRRATFNLARNLNFFREMESTPAGPPDRSKVRTLAYHDLGFSTQVTYGYVADPDVLEITSILEEASETLEFGRRLNFFHDHDRKALNSELIRMHERLERHRLRELQALAPALRNIVSDTSVESSAREQAQELLKLAR